MLAVARKVTVELELRKHIHLALQKTLKTIIGIKDTQEKH